jgi:hypothetical protein
MPGWTRAFIIDEDITAAREQRITQVYMMSFSSLDALAPDLRLESLTT